MKRLIASVILLPLLAACAPSVSSVVSPPTFRIVEAQTELVRLEPAGVGLGNALIHLELEARNPNPYPLRLAGLDGDFYLAGERVAGSGFRQGIDLPAGGSTRLGLDIEVPVSGAPGLITQLARLVRGEAVPYRLDGTVSAQVFGTTQRFPSLTVAQGELRVPGGLLPPTIRFDPASTQVRLSGLSAVLDVGLTIENPLPLGYYVQGPQVSLLLDGRPVGSASLPRTAIAADSTSRSALRFEVGLGQAGTALLTRLQSGGSGLQLGLTGQLEVEIPGLASTRAPFSGVGGLLP